MTNSILGPDWQMQRGATHSGSNRQVVVWLMILCSSLVIWLLLDLSSSEIYYDLYPFLLNDSGAKIAPRDLIDVRGLFNEQAKDTNATNAVGRLYERVHQMALLNIYSTYYIYSDQRDLERSGGPVSNQSACSQQLNWISTKLAAHADYPLLAGNLSLELSNFMDSFGRPQTGTLAGLTTWPGSYELCGQATLDEGRIRGRGCMARMRVRGWPQDERAMPKSRINIGICLPETCDTSSANIHNHKDQIEWWAKLELPEFYRNNLDLEEIYCFPDNRSSMRQIPLAGRIFLASCIGWLILLMFATLRDAGRRRVDTGPNIIQLGPARNSWDDILQGLSLIGVWREFAADPLRDAIAKRERANEPVRLDMRSLDFIKITMMIAIMLAHCVLIVAIQSRSIRGQVEMESNAYGRLLLSIGRSVDAYFMFFGLLIAYNAPKKFPLERLLSPPAWLQINLNILIRVWPLFFFLYCAARLLLPYMGEGPWWDYGTYTWSPRGACMRESWLKSVVHLGMRGEPRAVACLGPAWFIVDYVQLALLAPLITYLIYKLPNQPSRLLLLGYIFSISSLQLALHMHKQTTLRPEAFSICGFFLFMLFEKFEPTGTIAPIGRLACVAIGCYLGYLLRQYELGHIGRWPRWLASRASLTVALAVHLVVFAMPTIGYFIAQQNSDMSSVNHFLVGYSVAVFLWLGATAVELICCFTIFRRSRVVVFMSGPFWRLFNKLGLCIYLIHWEVAIFGISHNERAATYGSYEEAWRLFSYTLVLTIPLAFLVHILFEAPVTRLLRLFLEPAASKGARTVIQLQKSGPETGEPERESLGPEKSMA